MTARSVAWLLTSIFFSSTSFAQVEIDNLENLSLADFMNIEIESASQVSEKLEEVPVPVSVITQQMMRESGVRTLAEALDKFVPGYQHLSDRNSTLYAARGIHGTAQQKVLVMINGNRLNDRALLTESSGYGLALHNIKRIEVLRGGGSALYGNVAISGAVNLVTFKASELKEKTQASVSMGNFGQQRLRVLHGFNEGDADLLVWGQLYGATGQEIEVDGSEPFYRDLQNTPGNTNGSILLGRKEDPTNSDLGVVYNKGNFSLLARRSVDSGHEPYGSGNTVYDNNAIRTLAEGGPGEYHEKNNLSLKYGWSLTDTTRLTLTTYYDSLTFQINQVTDGTPGAEEIKTGFWQSRDLGMILSAETTYETSGDRGSLLYGVQADTFEVYDSLLLTSDGGLPGDIDVRDPATSKNNKFLNSGHEEIYSAFVQNKHYFTEKLIANVGARYDNIQANNGDEKSAISPRLALIYLPNENWEYKLSYTKSFVDAPYWYRYSQMSNRSAPDLQPEYAEFTQFQTTWKSSSKKLRNSTVFFHQHASDIITGVSGACGGASQPCYVNTSELVNAGIENEFAYREEKYSLIFKAEWSTVLEAEGYDTQNDAVENISSLQGSFVGTYNFTREILANIGIRYLGPQELSNSLNDDDAKTPGYTIVDLGYRQESFLTENMWIDLRAYNAMNTEWYQGGSTIPYRQPGSWYLATLGYKF